MKKTFLGAVGKDTLKGAALHAAAESAGFGILATAAHVTAGKIDVTLTAVPFAVEAKVFSAVGVARAWNGAVTVVGKVVSVDNTGATDFVAGDRVVIRAFYL